MEMEVEESKPKPTTGFPDFDYLGNDLTELILTHLPIRSIVRSSAVCKLWHSIVTTPTFSTRVSTTKKPWFFLYGQNNVFSKSNQAFAYDPEADEWIKLPTTLFPWSSSQEESFIGSNGFFFTTASSTCARFSYAPILKGHWKLTSSLRFSRCKPLVGVYRGSGYEPGSGSRPVYEPGSGYRPAYEPGSGYRPVYESGSRPGPVPGSGPGSFRFIVVGGVRFIGGLVDIEDRLAVEIYDTGSDSWELCPPLPADFRSGNSSQWLSSALFRGRFYVFGIYSCFISSFDLSKHSWSEVQILRPPEVMFSFLVASKDRLVLAGLCNGLDGPSFVLWRIDEETMEFSEMSVMPQGLMDCLFDSDEEDKFASLKCVGLGNLVYVFNEERHRNYPACVCEISEVSGKCSWRKVPNLTVPANRFRKVVSFCSTVSLDNIFGGLGA